MKAADVLQRRESQWRQLAEACDALEGAAFKRPSAEQIHQFARLYRAACADLALADAYQLPPRTIEHLHKLVGRAHNQLYRANVPDRGAWTRRLLRDVPRRIFDDRCVQMAFILFWGVFLLIARLSSDPVHWPGFAERILPESAIEQLESSFQSPFNERTQAEHVTAASFYIQHNTSIGLRCFAGGLLFIPGLFVMIYNAAQLGAAFGLMARPGALGGDNFFQFVTAHGPFELTAIVMSAAAGLRLGLSWVKTNGWSRSASLRRTATEVMPIISAAAILFALAALIEGFLSPSPLPYLVKAIVGVLCSGLITTYFVLLGFPWDDTEGSPP